MKRGTPQHPKTKRLSKALGAPLWGACGILELVWHFTQKFTPRGDIGRYTNADIAEDIGWTGDPDQLVKALVESGWLDECSVNRLVVHDWADHCDRSVVKYLKEHGLEFAVATPPGSSAHQCAPVRTECAPVQPEPKVCAPLPCLSLPEPSLAKPEPEPVTTRRSAERIPPPEKAISNLGQAGRQAETARDALEAFNVSDPALSALVRAPGITAAIVREEARGCVGGDKPAGLLVSRLCDRFSVTLPRGKLRGLDPSVAASAASLSAAVSARRGNPTPRGNPA